MKLTKNLITRDEAFALAPDYVAMVESKGMATLDPWRKVNEVFSKLKRGQKVVTCHDGQYVLCRVTSVDHKSWQAVDGPVIRVGNDEFTWRVDGADYAYPV